MKYASYRERKRVTADALIPIVHAVKRIWAHRTKGFVWIGIIQIKDQKENLARIGKPSKIRAIKFLEGVRTI